MNENIAQEQRWEKAANLVEKAYHLESVQSELDAVPADQRKDIINKMMMIDNAAHQHSQSAGAKFPELTIVDDGAQTWIGAKGDKLKELTFGERLNLAKPVNQQQIMQDKIKDTQWLGQVARD